MSMSERERTEKERMQKVERDAPDVTLRRGADVDRPVINEKTETVVSREPEMYVRGREPEIYTRRAWWMPPTGGILAIIAGSWNLLVGLGAVLGITILENVLADLGAGTAIGVGIGALMIVLGLISIIGGAFALMRRRWGIGLAGSIAALFPNPIILPFLMGVMSLIFVTVGKPAFRDTYSDIK